MTLRTRVYGGTGSFYSIPYGAVAEAGSLNKIMSTLSLLSPGSGMQLKRLGGKVWCNYFHLNDVHF